MHYYIDRKSFGLEHYDLVWFLDIDLTTNGAFSSVGSKQVFSRTFGKNIILVHDRQATCMRH